MSGSPLAHAVALFAAAPTWTDKEVLYAVGGTLGVVIPVAWGIVQLLTSAARGRAETAEAEQKKLQHKLSESENPDELVRLQERAVRAETDTDEAKKKVTDLEQEVKNVRAEADGYHQVAEAIRHERATAETARDRIAEELAGEQRRIKKALQKDGASWTEKVFQTKLIEFKPLDPETRPTPVISVLNLKGGVGKTTTTANLGAALAARGFRVLLIDLDLQGSLTGMFLPDKEVDELVKSGCLLEDFLTASFDAEFPNILDYARPIGLSRDSMLVPTTDNLSYAEMNLSVRWFLRDSNRDPRLLLRRELQLKRVTDRFDVVLLDCPPVLNVSCVNALAASDYVLVPVMPSKQVTDRVTILLERLREFQTINPDLNVMGFFANRTNGPTLTIDEENRLTALRNKCHDAWGSPVHRFGTFIPRSTEIRDAEDERRPLCAGDDTFERFLSLAREVADSFPTFCRAPGRAKVANEVVS